MPSFPSTSSLSALNNPTLATLIRNGTSASKTPSVSSKNKCKNKLIQKTKDTTKPLSVSAMLSDNGLTPNGTYEVVPLVHTSVTITPIKANGGRLSNMNMNLEENGETVVEGGLNQT